jgi:hypothetical protein
MPKLTTKISSIKIPVGPSRIFRIIPNWNFLSFWLSIWRAVAGSDSGSRSQTSTNETRHNPEAIKKGVAKE